MAGSDSETPAAIPKPGDILADKYEIERVLGTGGMGIVVAARHVTLGQKVAIKFLLPDVAAKQPEAAERFVREARASINLRSEHVAKVTDVGTMPDGAPYMVMEYLEGSDLQHVVREGANLPVALVVEYVLQATEALAEAHAVGIVHRDLKPANLFLSARADGSPLVKVLDFGISKAINPDERGITRTDAVLGSPGYMSPEQIRNAKNVDQRADVWGLGVILYELLTGAPPFDGDNIATLSAQIVLETPKSVKEYRSDIPEALADVVQRCLEKEPERRYQNVSELADALEPYASASAALIAQRVRRIVRAMSPRSEAAEAPISRELDKTKTVDVWEQPKKAGAQRQRAILLGAIGSFVLAGALGAMYFAGRSSVTPESEPIGKAQAGTVVSPPSVAQPIPTASAKAPTTQAVPEPAPAQAPQPSASATSQPRVQKRSVTRSSTAAKCPPGNTYSKGHCCPTGLAWQNGRCDRPLATSLP